MQEPAAYTGKVVCEGEGHLNSQSCLLEGPSHSRQNRGACVRMEIPDAMPCSLFPGQVRILHYTDMWADMWVYGS